MAIVIGMMNQDKTVREKWNKIPHEGETLTVEELILYLTKMIVEKYCNY